MDKNIVKKWFLGMALFGLNATSMTYALEEPSAGIVGKNEWLFYRYEMAEASHAAMTDVSLDLIQRFNRILSSNGVSLAVVMVPLKMRIYSEHLPDDTKINDYMSGNYERMRKVLQAARVNTVDLNSVFLESPKRNSDTPLFFRLDTHWSQPGALLAAETVKAAIGTTPDLKKAFEATPEVGMKIVPGNRKVFSKARDLVEQLPKDAPAFAREQTIQFTVSRNQPPKEDLLGNSPIAGITLVGSSYSRDWTGFADALRYVLQRDVSSLAVGADRGSWVGMESYLRDDAFQIQRPRMLIWEMPERDMRAPPDYKFREERYVSNNTEWLLRVSALIQTTCKRSTVSAKLVSAGLAASAANVKAGELVAGPTNDHDFVEIGFDRPIEKLDYLAARVSAAGSKTMTLEGSGPGVASRRIILTMPGDDAVHALKSPLPSNGNGYTKVRIYPGTSNGFTLRGLQVCHQPEDLLR